MELHIPDDRGTPTEIIQHLTSGLDAVVLESTDSTVYPHCRMYVLTGNPRDLSIAAERATKIGGVVD